MTNWLGSKGGAGVYQTIIANMPPHDVYIETHLGSGLVMREKPPASICSYGYDKDPEAPGLQIDLPRSIMVHGDCIMALDPKLFSGGLRYLIYADPPYVLASRSSHHRYRFDYTDSDHIHLSTALKALPHNVCVMVSGYPSKLYDDLYAGWRTIEFQAMTRGGVRTEKLWMNYPHSGAHWSTFAGKDHTDRQRIKRKAERWRAKYQACSPEERLAILAALQAPEA